MVDTLRGAVAVVGVGLVGYGAWLHYAPLGFISAGLLLLIIGLVGALRAH